MASILFENEMVTARTSTHIEIDGVVTTNSSKVETDNKGQILEIGRVFERYYLLTKITKILCSNYFFYHR